MRPRLFILCWLLGFFLPLLFLASGCNYYRDDAGYEKLLPAAVPSEFPFQVVGNAFGIWAGDQFQVATEQRTAHYVLLQGIDSPEPGQSGYGRCQRFLEEVVDEQSVLVNVGAADKWHRLVGRVFLGDLDLNLEVVLNGYAWYDRRQFPGCEAFAAAEKQARENKRGIWASTETHRSPWEWRGEDPR